jgi:hypothetical protein
MNDWKVEQVLESTYLTKFSDAQIQEFLVTPLSLPIKGYTQHVKRMICNITKQGTRAATAEKRNGGPCLCHSQQQEKTSQSRNQNRFF